MFSCVLALSPEALQEAKVQNISVLTYLANVTDNPFIATLGPLVAFIAITSSFLGHFLGARESLAGLLCKNFGLSLRLAGRFTIAILFVTIWIVAILNPSILGMMEAFSGPVIAMILFIMPMIAVFKVPSLAKYQQQMSTLFVMAIGLLAVSALLYNLLN